MCAAAATHTSGDGDYDYTLNPCESVTPIPTGCAGATSECEPAGCSAFQHTPDGTFCYAAGDVNSLEASFLDPSAGVVGSPGQGITLYWGSPLSTCGSGGIFRQTVLRLICGSGQENLGQGAQQARPFSPLSLRLNLVWLRRGRNRTPPGQQLPVPSIHDNQCWLPVVSCVGRVSLLPRAHRASGVCAFPSAIARLSHSPAFCCPTLANTGYMTLMQVLSDFLQRR
jgi:hypothetical protein